MKRAEREARNTEIIRRYQEGESARTLAIAFSLKPNAIREILERAFVGRRSASEAMRLANDKRWRRR